MESSDNPLYIFVYSLPPPNKVIRKYNILNSDNQIFTYENLIILEICTEQKKKVLFFFFFPIFPTFPESFIIYSYTHTFVVW